MLDAVDGRLARLLKGTSRFGAELDSLADFVNFGVAPAMLIYLVVAARAEEPRLGRRPWPGDLLRVAARPLQRRLDDPDKPPDDANFFTGAPAPAGAGLAMAPMYVGFLLGTPGGKPFATHLALHRPRRVPMVSRVPTFSGKTLGKRIDRDLVLPVLPLPPSSCCC